MFFEVSAKCGHVGENKYVIKQFYIKTTTAKEAARIIRFAPRVKHDQKDAILKVTEINYDEYVARGGGGTVTTYILTYIIPLFRKSIILKI